jgi:hypothetical protein
LALALGLAGLVGAALALAAANPAELTHRSIVPGIARAERTPTPTPTPTPPPQTYVGPVRSIYLESARLYGDDPIEIGGSHYVGSREILDDPTGPTTIMHYELPYLAEAPGFGGGHSIFAAHVDYVNYGLGPFAYITDAEPGDTLSITMANGDSYAYSVKSVEIVSLATLNMDDVVFPPLDSKTERVTLISCGGTFIPAAVGGEYTSRVILVAERQVP